MQNSEETELIARSLDGDGLAYAELVDRHKNAVKIGQSERPRSARLYSTLPAARICKDNPVPKIHSTPEVSASPMRQQNS